MPMFLERKGKGPQCGGEYELGPSGEVAAAALSIKRHTADQRLHNTLNKRADFRRRDQGAASLRIVNALAVFFVASAVLTCGSLAYVHLDQRLALDECHITSMQNALQNGDNPQQALKDVDMLCSVYTPR